MSFLPCVLAAVVLALVPSLVQARSAETCVGCHEKSNPSIIADWKRSKMAKKGIRCTDCHGAAHTCASDSAKAVRPAIAVCGKCHDKQAARFAMGKHGMAEKALSIPPMGKKTKAKSPVLFERSCATCHNEICKDGGQCDACHSGHRFSPRDARKPEACLPCHMGNHPQYEAYTFSKHGATYRMRGLDGGAPTCATCHMPGKDHMVKTSWGFFGVRGGETDADHAANQRVVRGAVEMLGPILAPDSFRPDLVQWNERRETMLDACGKCHARSRAQRELEAGDKVVAMSNTIAAQYITTLAELKALGALNENEYFWTLRDRMHAQRMSMYISAFHQHPEGVLLGFIHFQRESIEAGKQLKQVRKAMLPRPAGSERQGQ